MRVLLDACVPQDFRHALAEFDVVTARYAGLAALSNGDLLTAMEGKFDVLVTTDRKLKYQQDLTGRSISIIVLRGTGNRLEDLSPLVPELLRALSEVKPGVVREIFWPA
jgi:hypothetical protein